MTPCLVLNFDHVFCVMTLILGSGLIALNKLALAFFNTKLKSFLTGDRVDPGNAFLNTIPVKGKEPKKQKKFMLTHELLLTVVTTI